MVSKAIYGAVAIIVAVIIGVAMTAYIDDEVVVPISSAPPTEESRATLDVIDDDIIIEDKIVSNLPDVVNIGVMLYDTGTSASDYRVNGGDIFFAIDDFNAYLKEIDAHWRMKAVTKDTNSDPSIALEKIESFNSKGIKLVIGPESSAETRHIKPYVDSNDMMLISHISTSPDLVIADNIFRTMPVYFQQGQVLSLLFQEQGIDAVIPIYRGDIWGDSLYESTKTSFESLGGVMDEGIRYSSNFTPDNPVEVSLLPDLVDKYVTEYSTDEVAVLLMGSSKEPIHILNSADSYDNLHEIRWFGSADLLYYSRIPDDPTSATFVEDVNLISIQSIPSTNDVYTHVRNHFVNIYDAITPSTYVYYLYDSVFILGKTILATDSIDPIVIRDALPDVAATHIGATGTINLNEFGDRVASDYGLWTIRDGQWIEYGRFNSESGTFDYYVIDETM